jgi:phospholipid/cholesterol/gamma-HCH transport system substrate-binding protein
MLKHRARDRLYKRAVGLLVVCSLLVLLLAMRFYSSADRLLGKSFQLHAQVRNVNGLEVDAKVTMAGLKVGKVRQIDLLADKTAHFTLDIELRYHDLVRADSVATLTKPLIGSAVVDIGIGTPSQPRLEDEARITLLVQPDVNEVVATLPPKLEKVDHALDNLVAITDMARASVQRIAAPQGTLDATLAEARAATQNVRAATETLKVALADVRSVATSGQAAVGQAQAVLTDVRGFTRQSTAMAESLQRTLGNAEEVSLGLRTLVPQLGTSLHAAQGAAEEADKVLRAASNSVLLGGPAPAPMVPTLTVPRAP